MPPQCVAVDVTVESFSEKMLFIRDKLVNSQGKRVVLWCSKLLNSNHIYLV